MNEWVKCLVGILSLNSSVVTIVAKKVGTVHMCTWVKLNKVNAQWEIGCKRTKNCCYFTAGSRRIATTFGGFSVWNGTKFFKVKWNFNLKHKEFSNSKWQKYGFYGVLWRFGSGLSGVNVFTLFSPKLRVHLWASESFEKHWLQKKKAC